MTFVIWIPLVGLQKPCQTKIPHPHALLRAAWQGYNLPVPDPLDLIEPNLYPGLAAWLAPLDEHLAVFSLLAGCSAGRIFGAPGDVNDPLLVQVGGRLYLAGSPTPQNIAAVCELLRARVIAASPGAPDMYVLHAAPPDWIPALQSALADLKPLTDERTCLEHHAPGSAPAASFPEGYLLREVTPELLADPHLEGLDLLAEEMCSERESQEAFFERSFGLVLLSENRLAAFCLSEYNLAKRCEIGIATLPDYQRQGLAAQITLAFLAMAARRGIHRVGWHAWSDNLGSLATARKDGFSEHEPTSVLYGWRDPAFHHAVLGNRRLRQNDYAGALGWYEQAFNLGEPPAWAYWNAAICQAHLQQASSALAFLRDAAARGLNDPEMLQASPHFTQLHATSEWQALLAELQAGKQV